MVHKLKGQYILVPHEVFGERSVILVTPPEYNRALRRAHIAERMGIKLEGKNKLERYAVTI